MILNIEGENRKILKLAKKVIEESKEKALQFIKLGWLRMEKQRNMAF
ncbi:MAG: hypothetical protein ABFS35_07685 [Bacteroidota bacterium]